MGKTKYVFALCALVVVLGCDDAGETLVPDSTPSVPTTSSSTTAPGGGSTTTSAGGAGGSGGAAAEVAGYVSGTRLRARYYQGADGSKTFFGWYDSQRDSDCGFLTSTDGKKRCIPSGAPSVNIFLDANCTQPLLRVQQGCQPPAFAIVAFPPRPVCGEYQFEARPVAAQSGVSTTYYDSGGLCNSTATLAGYDLYTLGAVVPPSQFVEGTEMVE